MDPRETFGRNVLRLRSERGVSQETLAHAAGLHVTYLSSIENGRRNPSLRCILALAAALEVTPAELLAGIPAQPLPTE